jgi:hypothetical protein
MLPITRRFAVPALAAVAAALPLAIGPGGRVHEHHLHAQGDYCRPSPGDICIYNGSYRLDYEHVSGGG